MAPDGVYGRIDEPVATFGVMAALVSSTNVEAETIYAPVKPVFDELGNSRAAQPAFINLDPDRIVREGLTTPLHDSALRDYRERGMKQRVAGLGCLI